MCTLEAHILGGAYVCNTAASDPSYPKSTIQRTHYQVCVYSPIHEPAVARESTAIITPCSNLKPRVVVPWLNLMRTSLSGDVKALVRSAG